jgi:hypothetical protein
MVHSQEAIWMQSPLWHMKLPTRLANARAADMNEDEQQLHTDVTQSGATYFRHECLVQKRNDFCLSNGKLKHFWQQVKELSFVWL